MTPHSIPSFLRQARDAAIWRPTHATLLVDQVVDRDRNRRAAFSDVEHLEAAAAWLECAQDAAGDGGVAGRYRLRSGWTSAYPETTGYIIPTFLALANEPGAVRFRGRASRCVDFLLPLQLENGGFPGGEIRHNRTEASFFNTAQIIAGLLAWYRATNDARSIDAARRAGDWLLTLQEEDGAFRRHLYHGIVTTYGAHATCWLADLAFETAEVRYLDAAHRHARWVASHRDEATGWIDLCGFSEADHRARRSVTHTIAYTLWGLLATARAAGDEDMIAAVSQASLGIARRLELSGSLPGMLDHRWRPAATFSCLTGNAQMALVWFALYERTADTRLLNAALKAIDLVKRAQPMESTNRAIRGGIPGSDPIWGDYLRFALPNWSSKFFIDALLKKRAVLASLPQRERGVAPLLEDVPGTLPEPSQRAQERSPRIVILATPSSKKVGRLLRSWTWGFRPSAVVLLSRPRARQRLWQRISEDGFMFFRRRSGTPQTATESGPGARTVCREAGIPTVDIDSFETPSALAVLRALEPDLFVFAGGAILRAPLLEIPRLGTLNAHMGLLPFYRGMNVAEWACFHGDPPGATVHLIDPGIDTGDILCTRPVCLQDVRSVAALRSKVDEAQIAMLGEVVRYVASSGELPARRRQAAAEGRQYFRMHDQLLEVVERELRSSGDHVSQLPGRESALSVPV